MHDRSGSVVLTPPPFFCFFAFSAISASSTFLCTVLNKQAIQNKSQAGMLCETYVRYIIEKKIYSVYDVTWNCENAFKFSGSTVVVNLFLTLTRPDFYKQSALFISDSLY